MTSTPPHSGERKQTRVEKRQVENADKYPDTCFCADPNAPYCRVHDPGPFPDPLHQSGCLCGSEGPDEFGNYDQIEHPECPIHGDELLTIDYDAAAARLELLLHKEGARMTSGERVEPVERFTLNACEDCAAHHSTQPRWGCQHFDDRTESVEVLPTQALSALVEKWLTRAEDVEAKARRQEQGGVSDASRCNVAIGVALREAAADLRQLLDPPE